MINLLVRKLLGTKNDRYIKKVKPLVNKINALEPEMEKLADEDFARKIAEYKAEVEGGRDLNSLRAEVFALVREASKRVLGMRHFDVQLIGALVLHSGRISEMKTGEGKTLMATLAVVLNALSGKGVHLVTVNDYLAKRDAAWMGKLYNFLGLSVGVIVHGLTDEERKAAYAADITYGTNNEFGFDYLRDNMKFYPEQLVQREHNFAIVDEVDSILIDEARTPLIISGASGESTDLYRKIDTIIPNLKRDIDFTLDEKARTAMLTDDGVAHVEKLLNIENLFDTRNITLQHHVLQALKAHTIFKRDVDYLVSADNEVVIVDEFTGRPMPGRRFSDGLHQALEAKERVKVEAENQTLASITFQNYFRLYKKLSGMTGTADTEAVEFQEIYGLEVISIPTHRDMIRQDYPDLVYRTKKEKYEAIASAIKELHKKGQPVLVGTISIESSELLSHLLKKEGVPHEVLNAKQHEREAAIVAEAGQKGHVTIATNMAGRGTDIVLGEGVRELGGLHILGTERHESRRIDNQLRGRAGRQGDPGSSRFYIALEDDLMRLFGADKHMKLMETLGLKDGEAIEHPLISRGIMNAQKRVEGHNFEIRKSLLDFDNVMNQQREVIYSLRREAMLSGDISGMAREFITDVLDEEYEAYFAAKGNLDDEDAASMQARLNELFTLVRAWPEGHPEGQKLPTREQAEEAVMDMLTEIKAVGGEELYTTVLRYFILEELDRCWKEHLLAMDQLRDGIGLRGYGQRDPKQEYKREGFAMFQGMLLQMKENICRNLTRAKINMQSMEEAEAAEAELAREADEEMNAAIESAPDLSSSSAAPLELRHTESQSLSYSGGEPSSKQATVKRDAPKMGRNDLCPCGSGKKYKKCCGK